MRPNKTRPFREVLEFFGPITDKYVVKTRIGQVIYKWLEDGRRRSRKRQTCSVCFVLIAEIFSGETCIMCRATPTRTDGMTIVYIETFRLKLKKSFVKVVAWECFSSLFFSFSSFFFFLFLSFSFFFFLRMISEDRSNKHKLIAKVYFHNLKVNSRNRKYSLQRTQTS